jgi:hypothetical protein
VVGGVLMSVVESEKAALDIDLPLIIEALDFEAPYVVERLVSDRVADTEAEAKELFDECKKYLVLSVSQTDVIVGMCSTRVDEAWHAFLLYTDQYRDFCKRYFGRYIGHTPKNAPQITTGEPSACRKLNFAGFQDRYEAFFGEPLPDVWFDIRNVAPDRRIFNDSAATMTVARHDLTVDLVDEAGAVVLSVNDIAAPALNFITRTGAFYVRELPGELTDGEKVALIESLLRLAVVRLAP